MISPDLERAMALKVKATTHTLKPSHAPMASHPAELATFIMEAAKKSAPIMPVARRCAGCKRKKDPCSPRSTCAISVFEAPPLPF